MIYLIFKTIIVVSKSLNYLVSLTQLLLQIFLILSYIRQLCLKLSQLISLVTIVPLQSDYRLLYAHTFASLILKLTLQLPQLLLI